MTVGFGAGACGAALTTGGGRDGPELSESSLDSFSLEEPFA